MGPAAGESGTLSLTHMECLELLPAPAHEGFAVV